MKKQKKKRESVEAQPMPFNEALKRVWAAPPQPKKAKTISKKKKKARKK